MERNYILVKEPGTDKERIDRHIAHKGGVPINN